MKLHELLVATFALACAAGCASTDAKKEQTAQPKDEPCYRTGSRIPVKNSSECATATDKSTIDDMTRRSQIHVPGPGGGM